MGSARTGQVRPRKSIRDPALARKPPTSNTSHRRTNSIAKKVTTHPSVVAIDVETVALNVRTRSMPKKLKLQRPMVTIDVETTGLNINSSRIIEISCIKLHPDGRREIKTHRLNPECPISEGATQVNGIRNKDVADCPTFAQMADELLTFMSGCDLSGFNIERFDLPLLTQEFARVKINFPAEPVHVVDTLRIFMLNEPRDLRAAFRFYCNSDLLGAHGAEADASAAADILLAQVHRYEDLPVDVPALHDLTKQTRRPDAPAKLDPDGKIVWCPDKDQAVLNFGMYRNSPLRDVAENDSRYLRYLIDPMRTTFSPSVIGLITNALAGDFPASPVASVVKAL